MTKKDLHFDALHGIETDGAPVMTGKNGGAVKLLIEKQQALTASQSIQAVGIHCAAHRLNLAACQAAKEVPYVSKFKGLWQQLYNFYGFSSVRKSGLSAVQNIPEQGGEKITELSATLWLGVGGSCTAIRNDLSAIMVSVSREAEERSDIEAAGLLKFATSAKFVGTLLMMCELLPLIDRPSRTLQTSLLHVDLVQGLITSCIKTLEAQSNIQTKVQEFCVSHDIQVAVTEEAEQWLCSTERDFTNKLVQNRGFKTTLYWPVTLLCLPAAATQMVGGNEIKIANSLEQPCPTLGRTYTEDVLPEWIAFANFVLECDRLQKLTAVDFLLFVAHCHKLERMAFAPYNNAREGNVRYLYK